ncbi:hypothetical protein EVAR_56792_1 [Eumeta japonica]|uniref:Integrase zinc-binding domain-containing protein n=1 Tax=Eumeta variegata TaxID=151549 RepID=A0A4C1Y050_EUMVA|nr:hypothetical protein EVAR_56792_1 [Eumeta japonica]
MSHPGIRTSRKLMAERYFWPNMNRDVGSWAKSWIQCQRAKVQIHIISDLGRFSPSERFGHIHVDIVGPLPTAADDWLRAVARSDKNVSAAKLTFGKTLRLPGDFYDIDRNISYDSYEYVQNLIQSIDRLKPRPAARNSKHIFVYPNLKTCNKVFVRSDTVRKTLQPRYDGPFNVIKRSDKIFTLQLPDREAKFPIDRLKPDYVLNETDVTDETSPQKVHFTPLEISSRTSCPETPKVSRSGRTIRHRYVLHYKESIRLGLEKCGKLLMPVQNSKPPAPQLKIDLLQMQRKLWSDVDAEKQE